MKFKIFFPILLLVFPFIISAQSTAKEWYDKGLKLKDTEEYEEALTAFKNAISKKADYSDAYYQAGQCCNELENYEDAIDFFKKYNPSSNDAKKNKYNELGFSYYSLQNGKDGLEQYNKTLALFPNNGTAIRGIGNIYYEIEEDYDQAIGYYERALKVDEENSRPVYYNLGWLYNDGERYDDAVKVLLKGIEYDSEESGYREELGYAYYMREEYEFAITQLNKAISLDESSRLGYYYKGLCFVATNKKGDAMSMYYKLKELESEHTEELMEKIKAMK
jgi:tetratricopeptide (TPR) repeat protein